MLPTYKQLDMLTDDEHSEYIASMTDREDREALLNYLSYLYHHHKKNIVGLFTPVPKNGIIPDRPNRRYNWENRNGCYRNKNREAGK